MNDDRKGAVSGPGGDGGGRPFDLGDDAAYRRWRDERLQNAPIALEALVVEVADPAAPTAAERAEIARRLGAANMAIYAGPPQRELGREDVRALSAAFGLHRLDANMLSDDDGITPLAVAPGGTRTKYIPYTNRPLAWHTDGYYNAPDRQVRAIVLHCVRPAARGGENALLDHEIAYILLRDRDPAFVAALMRDDAMLIPGNAEEGEEPRPDRPGPVFRVMPDGRLHMRYTRRKTNIVWSPDPVVQAAAAALEDILDSDAPWILRGRLEAGQGLICANVLHNRTRFEDAEDGAGRMVWRARYHDAIRLDTQPEDAP